LLPVSFACLPSIADAGPGCEIEQAQRLFGQHPRPTAQVERLLAVCQASGSKDYRIDMFLGVMAREAGHRTQAITHLRKAYELAPQEVNPALELGFTLEAKRPREAREVYEQILARDPASRPAMLGLARVARSQNRLDEARGVYKRLLAVNPRDPEALNGIAWLALANRHRHRARAGFEQVLAMEPTNEEAKIGLSDAPNVYRYLLETSGLVVTTPHGTAWGYQARGTAAVTAFDTLELGWRHFNSELSTVSATGFLTLPSQDITVGYHRLVPLSYAFSLVYDYRYHADIPTAHWIDGRVDVYVTDRLIWFVDYRQAFGGFDVNGRLVRTGLSATVAPRWSVTATVYDSAQPVFQNSRDLWSWTVDVTYAGPRNTLLTAGVGTSPLINNVDVHARGVLPVTDRIGLQLIAAHNSSNAQTSVTGGLLFTW
jgi:tetratricopeptide (TPR) repeat protein